MAGWIKAKAVRVRKKNGRTLVDILVPGRTGGRKRNESVAMGFWRGGVFHPIRASDDYDPEAVGERHQYAPRKKKAKKRRR